MTGGGGREGAGDGDGDGTSQGPIEGLSKFEHSPLTLLGLRYNCSSIILQQYGTHLYYCTTYSKHNYFIPSNCLSDDKTKSDLGRIKPIGCTNVCKSNQSNETSRI